MPQLPEPFDAGNLRLTPTETGTEAFAAAGRRLGGFGSQEQESLTRTGQQIGSGIAGAGGEIVDKVTQSQVSHGSATFAKFFANKTDEWNKLVASPETDPNNTQIAGQFRDGFEQDADKLREAFTTEAGQKWAEAHIEAMRNHFFEKTTSDMGTLAKQAATVNAQQAVNSLSNTVLNDPSALDYALDHFNTSVNGIIASHPNLTGVAAGAARNEITEKGREQIVKSAAFGEIQKTGQVPAWVSDPKYAPYVSGMELKQFAQNAQFVQRTAQGEARQQRQEKDYNDRKDFNTKIDQLEASTMPQNAGERPTLPSDYWSTLRTLSTHPGAAIEPGRLASMIQKGEALTERLNKPEPMGPISHQTTMDMLGRIRANDESRLTDNGPIYDAYRQGKLNTADFHFLTNEFNNIRTPDGMALEKDRSEFLKSYARLIDGGMNATGEHSLLGTQNAYQFEMEARRQEQVLRQQGKDPHLVYDPRAPEFWGRPENLARYRVSLQEAQKYDADLKTMDAQNAKAPPAAAPRAAPAAPAPKIGERKQFRQGWGVWNGQRYVPDTAGPAAVPQSK